jgi:hypothetical protein
MGAFKSFEAKDIIITPFVVNKGFSFYGDSEFIGSGLDKFIGTNLGGLFSTNTSKDILDYSLNIFKSESSLALSIGNHIDENFTIIEDPSNLLISPLNSIIEIPQNSNNTQLFITFSGDYSFYSDPSINSYRIWSYVSINESSPFLFFDEYFTSSNFVEGLFITHSFNYNRLYTPLPGDKIRINHYLSATPVTPDRIVTFETLNTSFKISSQSLAPSSSNPLTGINNDQYQRLIYDSIKQLYYTNYIGNPYPNPIYYTGSGNYAQFDNYLQSYPLDVRYFPTASNAQIGVINVPSKVYGEYVKPGSFIYQSASVYVYDDGEGNLLNNIDSTKCGNMIYSHGLAIITTSSFISNLSSFITSPDTTCSFSSSLTLFETQYKCNIKENEFNFSQNPSIISGSNGNLYGYATSSYFDPYITTVGLYNENQDLIAVAKLSQPLPSSRTTDTNIIINLDK